MSSEQELRPSCYHTAIPQQCHKLKMSTPLPKGFEQVPKLRAGELFSYEFQWPAIVGKDSASFLEFFDLARIQRAQRLHDIFGAVNFAIGGFNHDCRALHEIPEVREFVGDLVAAWPYFFYADALENGFLTTVVYCLLDTAVMIDRDDEPDNFAIQFSPTNGNLVCRPLFEGLRLVSGMDSHLNQSLFDARIEAIHHHLQNGLR